VKVLLEKGRRKQPPRGAVFGLQFTGTSMHSDIFFKAPKDSKVLWHFL
jgi:hypothetical protein